MQSSAPMGKKPLVNSFMVQEIKAVRKFIVACGFVASQLVVRHSYGVTGHCSSGGSGGGLCHSQITLVSLSR